MKARDPEDIFDMPSPSPERLRQGKLICFTRAQLASKIAAERAEAVAHEREECAKIADTCYQQAKMDEKNGYAIERGDTSACWIMQRIRARAAGQKGEGDG